MSSPTCDGDLAATWYQRAPRALWRRSGHRVVVLPPGASTPLVLDGAGQRIWALLDPPITEAELVSELARSAEVSPEQIGDEVQVFLTDLVEHGAATITRQDGSVAEPETGGATR